MVSPFSPTRALFELGVALWAVTGVWAGDPIKFSDHPRSIEVPTSRSEKAARQPFDSLSPQDSLGAVLETPYVPALSPRNSVSKQKQEEIRDRQRNWIFSTPQPEQQQLDLKELFHVRPDSPGLDEVKTKKVIQRFLEEFETKKEKDKKTLKQESFTDPKSDRDPLNWDRSRTFERASDRSYERSYDRAYELTPLTSSRDPFLSDRTDSPLGSIRNDLFGLQTPNRLGLKRPAPGEPSEFEKFISPRATTTESKPFGPADPINLFSDSTRQSLNPVVGVTPQDEARRPNIFAPPTASAIVGRGPGSGALDSFSPKFLGQSTLGSSIAPSAPISRLPHKPIILEIPTRKF